MKHSRIQHHRLPPIALALLAVAVLLPPPASACSTFRMQRGERIIFGKNYDWSVDDGLLVVNKRNVAKVSGTAPEDNPVRWISRYGSVTFNQYGREFPNGGINEAGLVIEVMWLHEARYPEPDERPTLGCLQWIQYQLDTAATVKEVLASDERIRITSAIPLHFLVADGEGDAASVEFLDGKMVAHTGDNLPAAVLTNTTYGDSLAYLRRLEKEGREAPDSYGSVDRFARAAARVRAYESEGAWDGGQPVAHAFETLADVAQGEMTQWSIVYELDRRRLSFRTQGDPAIRNLSLADVDFDCGSPVMVADLNSGPAGDLAGRLQPYTRELNAKLLETSYSKSPEKVRATTDGIARLAAFPETTSCRN
jgi:choloylglycine hydrolase